MGKPMAQLDGIKIVNMIWCSDSATETETLKDPRERPVGIGDTYESGKWYRDGMEILTPLEEAQRRIAELECIKADQAAALAAIYTGVTE